MDRSTTWGLLPAFEALENPACRPSSRRWLGWALLSLAVFLRITDPASAASDLGAPPSPDCPPAASAVPLVNPQVLGNGSPGSVTTAQIQAALNTGGHISFDLGPAPVTIPR